MFISRPDSGLPVKMFSLLLSYTLFISLCTPFIISKVEAASSPKKTAPTTTRVKPITQNSGESSSGLLVRFQPMASEQEINTLIESKGMRRVRKLRGRSGLELLGLLYDQNAETAAADLRLNNVVEFAEANYIIKSDTFDPGNQRFYKQWPLTDRNNGLLGPARGSANSLITTQGLGSTVIAVIDSGIDWTHPDLSNKQWVSDNEQANSQDDDHDGFIDDQSGWDFVAESGHESDEQGHGTAVAGLIATQGNSAISIAGVMWQPRLMSLRVLDATGTGDVARAIEAIDYAGAHGAKVINCSWGTNGDSQALGAAIERAAAHGVVVVCSAGNAGRDIETAPRYPASFDLPNIIAVASSDNLDQLAPWSNWGALHVAVAAPGVNVSTTKVGGGYQAVSGTSASAAVVSGMVGLIKSLRPGLSAELTKELVMRGARRVAALQGKVASGGVVKAEGITGMVNVLPPDDGSENVSGGTNAGSHNSDISPREEGISVPGTMGDQFRVAPPEPTRGTPGPNLPNLDEMRHLRATPPRAQPPIPSTRCSSHIDCGQQKPAAPADEPSEAGTTDTPIARQESVIVDLLTFNKDFPAIESLLGRDTGPVSDSPFTLKLSSHIAGSQPSSLMPVLQTGVDFSTPRLDPVNRTGTGGEDLISGNYNWNLPLVALPGRAGLDLGLSLSYNSLVWTKSGSSITYDADRGFPSPGFRLGFPTIQQRFYNTQTGIYAYLLITPSGSRVELRQVGASNVYEAADSSYLQLTDYGTGQMLLRTTEGTQLSYSLVNAEYRCTQIKDRNGNFITANYDVYGHITTIIDTLGRTLTFTYDVNHNPTAITQLWNGVTHQWVTFGYANLTIQTTYSGLSIVGLQNGSTIPVLSQVSLHDGSAHRFSYSSWGQVYRIAYYAFDGHQRRQLTYNLPQTAGVAQSDCPRFTQRRDWAENWNGDAEGVLAASEEAVTTFGAFNFAGGVRQATMPDNTIYKEFFQTTGWQKGLTTRTEILSGAVLKKWTTTAWTQDDISLLYQKNPRVTETNIYDAEGNRRRTTIGYGPYAAYGLPYVVSEYAADAATIVRETYTDYNLSTTYLNQRIIGLVSAVHITNGQAYQAKIAYSYDATGTQLVATSVGATRHDAGYGTSFAARGNLTSVSRYDVTDINNTTKALTATLGYDIDGSVIFSRDEQGHQTSISYTDSFSDSVNRNTFAYPTTVTDADNYSSTSQYSYELGAVTRLQDPKGAVQTREYDEAGRIKWVRNPINSAWQFFAYPDRGDAVQNQTTIQAGANAFYSITVFDGADRVRATAGDLPNSTGLYAGSFTNYDAMGRVAKKSNVAEINSVWVPVGDDAAGWLWSLQSYDWKGRPALTTNTDGTTTSSTYGGCGCAGGETVEVRDELGRRRKDTSDVLGRTVKSEVFNTDGTVYSTVVNTYNALDKTTNIRQYQGANTSTVYQDTLMSYDGYGRLFSRKLPQQSIAATYTYFADDLTKTVTDGRGAVATYAYNNRHLVTGISYTAPAGITATASASFGYDSAGNRTSMTDGRGSATYHYDTLSRMDWETRTFTGVAGTFQISYSYNLAGQLTSITDPFNSTINYTRDAAGRTTAVSGSLYAGVTSYVSNIQYRAWGAVKSASYGNNSSSTTSYDSRLRPAQFRLTNTGGSIMREDYSYYADGRLQKLTDLDDTPGTNPPSTLRYLSRTFNYDQVGRVTSGTGSGGGTAGLPYGQAYGYDAFGNMTSRSGAYYFQAYQSETYTYTNNRRSGWTYDADGRILSTPASANANARTMSYDAAGRQIRTVETASSTTTYDAGYDGNGQVVSEVLTRSGTTTTTYHLRSSVLGGKTLTTITPAGTKQATYVPAEGLIFARQQAASGSSPAVVVWTQRDPVGLTESGRSVYDPLGNYIPFQQMADPRPLPGSFSSASAAGLGSSLNDPYNYGMGCNVNGMPTNCSLALRLLNNGSATIQRVIYNGGPSVEALQFASSVSWVEEHSGSLEIVPGIDPETGEEVDTTRGTTTGHWEFFGHAQGRQSGPQRQPATQVVPLPDLRAGIQTLLKKGDCGKYVQELLDKAASMNPSNPLHGKTIMEVFEKITKQGGYHTDAHYYNTVSGDLFVTKGGQPATVHLLPWNTYGSPTAYQLTEASRNYIYGALHETFHLAAKAGFNDEQMTRAAYALAGKDIPAYMNGSKNFFSWSGLFDDELLKHCPK